MNYKKILAATLSVAISLSTFSVAKAYNPRTEIVAEAASISDMPSEFQYAADWIWTNRIEREKSTERWNTIFDQIIAGKGSINYIVKWQSYKTVTYEQRQQFEKMLSDSINAWNDCLVGYENWPYNHIEVKVKGWAVIDKSCLLDLHDDEIVYSDTKYYDSQYDTSNGREDIPDKEPYAPSEISRFDHFEDSSYQYPNGLDDRFDMYMWATEGFPDVGGCGGDWGQRLSDNAYLSMINNGSLHVIEHEIGHGFGITDFYGGEGEIDGFPPGGFPGGENSIMMAGSATKITEFDGWLLRYMWSKIKDQSGRFDLENAVAQSVEGDVNADGICNVSDLVTLQKWILNVPGSWIADWKASDLCEDNKIDSLDLAILRKKLVETTKYTPTEENPVQKSSFITANLSKHGASLSSQGNAKLVVFYVDFPDCKYDFEPSLDELNQISFGSADTSNPCYPFESFSAFYSRASKGTMNFDGQVFRYTTKENQSAYDENKVKIAEECYEAFKDSVDFSQFDGNGDGKIDATLFTVPVKSGDDNWWPCAGAFGDSQYSVDGVGVGHIITGNAQIESATDFVNYISSYCHELGHCTGLPDYYLYTNANDSEGMHGTAGIELMDTDAGSDFGAFSKLVEGWYREDQVQVYDAEKGKQSFVLNDAQSENGNCIIIPNGNLASDYFSEYFIIEYASKNGNNSGVGNNIAQWVQPGEGVRIYHIDATTEYGWNIFFRYASGSEYTNNDECRRLIRIIDDTEKDNFYHAGDVIDNRISGFKWYDSNGYQTVDTGLKITVGELKDGKYTVTIE